MSAGFRYNIITIDNPYILISHPLTQITLQTGIRRSAPNRWSTKSCMSAGFRYHNGNMIATDTDSSELMLRHYVFEALIGKIGDRSLVKGVL